MDRGCSRSDASISEPRAWCCSPTTAVSRNACLRAGVYLDDGRTGKTEVDKIRIDTKTETTTFFLILKEGRKRQIRLSMQRLKHPVKKLVRVRMGPLRLGRLAPGVARPLRAEEVRALLAHAAGLKAVPKRRGRRGDRGG